MLTSKFIKTDAVKITGNVFVFTLSLSPSQPRSASSYLCPTFWPSACLWIWQRVEKKWIFQPAEKRRLPSSVFVSVLLFTHTHTRCRFRFNFQKTFFFVFISKSNHSWVRHSVEQSVHFLRPLNLHVLVSFGRQCLNIVAVLIQDSADSFLATGNAVPEEQPSSVWRLVCLFCSLEDFTNIKTWK